MEDYLDQEAAWPTVRSSKGTLPVALSLDGPVFPVSIKVVDSSSEFPLQYKDIAQAVVIPKQGEILHINGKQYKVVLVISFPTTSIVVEPA